MAPEALKYAKFSSATDVWAYGVTIWEIYTLGQFPYSHVQNNEIRKQILNGLTLRIPDQVPDSIKNVISQCWIFLPEKRCSFDDIVTRIAESKSSIPHTTIPFHDEVIAHRYGNSGCQVSKRGIVHN